MNDPRFSWGKLSLTSSKSLRSVTGVFAVLTSLWLSQPAGAIDPSRLHMVPFGRPASLNRLLPEGRTRVAPQQEQPLIHLFETGPQWTSLGPSPIPNGQILGPPGTPEVPVSGRVSAIAVDPDNPNIVYVGAAQGGVFRSFDGGQTWTSLFVGAKNFAIGCITIDPRDHNTVLIGTGEGNLSADSYFGIGVYVVRNATSDNPVLRGPFNLDPNGANVFSARSIVSIQVDPKNDNIVFCATSSGVGGLGANTGLPGAELPARGLFRSTNFMSKTPRFTRLNVGPGTNTIVTSAVLDPANPNHLVCSVFGQVAGTTGNLNPEGGIYYTNNALAANPTFTRAIVTDVTADGNLPVLTNVKLAAARPEEIEVQQGGGLTVLAATDEFDTNQLDQGLLRKSTDGGKTFPIILKSADGFAGGQGFYNIAIAIDQRNPQNVYLAGTLSSTGVDPDGPPGNGFMYIDGQVIANPGPLNPAATGHGPPNGGGTFQYSRDGGTTFTPSVVTLHADSHAIAIAPSNSNVIYTGNDGGVWASTNQAVNWNDINTPGFMATQFESVAVHPSDAKFTLGGTQDNGTIIRFPNGSFFRADFGDGGYALIDQAASDTEHVTMYHTYFNVTNDLIGFGRVLSTSCAQEGEWSFMGIYGGPVDPTVHCDGTTDTFNGIQITDNVNFYAPMALGPPAGNGFDSVYFGTDTLYRSSDRGTTMPAVSQAPIEPIPGGSGGVPISAIGISPLGDNIRVVGLDDGTVWGGITTALSPLIQIDGGQLPAVYICRVVMDPVDLNTAYLAFNGYGLTNPGQQIWVTHNLVGALLTNTAPTWIPAGNGIPSISVNGLVIDPLHHKHLYAGTDHGVYASVNGGANWTKFGIGFPDCEIFDLTLQSPNRILRAATHGLGIWETTIAISD
jgi:hypothetical protein